MIGERIKARRIELNMTQQELATKVGYTSRSAINKIEKDLRDINQSQIMRFANALETTPAYLMGWEKVEQKSETLISHSNVMAKNIKHYMKIKDVNAKELSKALNVPYTTVLSWINAEYYPRIDKIEKMSDFFGCLKSDLIEDKTESPVDWEDLAQYGIMPIKTKKLPMLGNIACGEPVFAAEEHGEYIDADGSLNADFCLRAKGDSMINARIYDSDIVFIRKQSTVENGEIAAVLIDDEATLKRVYFDRDAEILRLFAENPQYKTMSFVGEELNKIKILGKAVAFQSALK